MPNPVKKFSDPLRTAKGDPRAHVSFVGMKTLWFNTGTLCNIQCANCYIESSPLNDRLVYLTCADIRPFLDELDAAGEAPIEIGFTGGEPFMAPEIIPMLQEALQRKHDVLVLTNAMRPLMRPLVQLGLLDLQKRFGDALVLRVSLDHYTAEKHDEERGANGFAITLEGLRWLSEHHFKLALAGRSLWEEDEAEARRGYAELIAKEKLDIDAADPKALVLFPEMRPDCDPPEISTGCWDILPAKPEAQMCASQRMVVRRKGASSASVAACTLLPYAMAFDLGTSLKQARCDVSLNHPWCASFCVLGGGSCSA